MTQGFQFADIIFLAIVAGFILYRLIQTFGKQSGFDGSEQIRKAMKEHEERVISISSRKPKAETQETAKDELALVSGDHPQASAGLAAIKSEDNEFSPTEFMQGARIAFEWVVSAFSKGDKNRLKQLLANDIYESFASEIDRRAAEKKHYDVTLVAIPKAEITEAEVKGGAARIAVQFQSEQIHVVRDESGKIIEGDASEVETVIDEWTFARELRSRTPDWKIIQT